MDDPVLKWFKACIINQSCPPCNGLSMAHVGIVQQTLKQFTTAEQNNDHTSLP